MKKESVDYTEAIALKELGFDEPCMASWTYTYELQQHVEFKLGYIIDGPRNYTNAPTFSQAFRWFREKYDLHPYIITLKGEWIVIGIIRCSDAEKITGSFDTSFNTLEEAELASLKKLIEIVKEK